MENIRIRDPGWKKFGSGINIPDPQHCSGGSRISEGRPSEEVTVGLQDKK
jgi:hypothetical protein